MTTEEQLQARIDGLPHLHKPMPYAVHITDKRGKYLDTRYVRASSPERANLVGLRVNLYIFGVKKSADARSSRHGWLLNDLKDV